MAAVLTVSRMMSRIVPRAAAMGTDRPTETLTQHNKATMVFPTELNYLLLGSLPVCVCLCVCVYLERLFRFLNKTCLEVPVEGVRVDLIGGGGTTRFTSAWGLG